MSSWHVPITRKTILDFLMEKREEVQKEEGQVGVFSSEYITQSLVKFPEGRHYNRTESILQTLTRKRQVIRLLDGGKRYYKFRSQSPADIREEVSVS
jgi:hypothetical protein